jgi:tRNA pseudouridine55 synthase
VVAVVRGIMAIRRIGHGGTLDPLATGLLPILVGGATKYAARIHEAAKVYDAVVRFGRETSTDDREGSVVREAAVPRLDQAALEGPLRSLRGVIEQVPPAYAAVKVAGRRAYARARAGETLELPARRVQILRLDVIGIAPPDLRVLVVCSSGTYVRALARDLGRAVASAAHLAALRRLAVGALEVRDAIAVDDLRAQGRETAIRRMVPATDSVLALDERFVSLPAATIVGAGEAV